MKSANAIKIIIILILVFFTFTIAFPDYLNSGIDFLNSKLKLGLPKAPKISYKLGLDLLGGSRLIYEADLKSIPEKEKNEAMSGLRDVLEKRVNLFGVREPVVRTQKTGDHFRLNIELPGIKDVKEAIKMIGETPYLEFKEQKTEEELKNLSEEEKQNINNYFKETVLTGRFLKKAELAFDETTYQPHVLLEFNSEGSKLFKEITTRNIKKPLAIFIDNNLISSPVVEEAITQGKARITGNFTVEKAKKLARNLNAGALPVPITLISQITIGPTLGAVSLEKIVKAAIIAFILIAIYMIVFYRLSGFFAFLALLIYILILLTLFKVIPITLSLAGIGGLILSVGMAVDANVLIFERIKEELKSKESFSRALEIGFSRAWPSIRDSNLTTLIIAFIMLIFGTSFVQGFAVTLSLGILISMFSALFITETFLKCFIGTKLEKYRRLWT